MFLFAVDVKAEMLFILPKQYFNVNLFHIRILSDKYYKGLMVVVTSQESHLSSTINLLSVSLWTLFPYT